MTITYSAGTPPSGFTAINVVTTQSIVVPAKTRILFVAVEADGATNVAKANPNYVRYNGVDMTLVAISPVSANGQWLWVYQLNSPTVGTFDITVLHDSTATLVTSAAVVADRPCTVAIGTGVVATTQTPSASITSTTGKEALFFFSVNNELTTTVSETGGQSIVVEAAGATNTEGYLSINSKASTASSTSMSWSLSASQRGTIIPTLITEQPQDILLVGTGNSVQVGATGVAISTFGFTSQPVATTDNVDITVTITGGSSNNWTANIIDRAEATAFPAIPITFTLTLTNGSEVATKTVTLTKKSTETLVTFVSPVTNNNKFLGYWLNAAGHTVDGAGFWYVPFGDLVVTSDSACLTTTAGTFTGWLRPAAGATAGKVYQFTVTVNETGVVTSVSGLTQLGLTASGLTRAGLTSAGL